MRLNSTAFLAVALGLFLFSTIGRGQDADMAAKVDALIAKMTPEEKAAQLEGVWFKDLLVGNRLSIEACQKEMPHGIGEVSAFGSTPLTAPELKTALADLQNYLRTQTRPGLPAIPHDESITGMAVTGSTTYPQMIGMACTWDPELMRENADATRQAMRWVGGAQALSPVLDVHNNAHWGRIEEAFGEEPYVTSLMGLAFVEGIQGSDLRHGIGATAKHFAGYGGGTEDLGLFRDEVLMPHEVAVRVGHISSVMGGYHEFQGVPCSASQFLLGDVLRREWGFQGIVVSDYQAIKGVFSSQKYAPNLVAAAKVCLEAGMDVDLPSGDTYRNLPAAMADGTIPVSLVDRAVRRVLTQKFKLGLMDPANEIDEAKTYDVNSPTNRERAYRSACESLVLLKNEGNVLPLGAGIHSIAVVGPNADSYYSLLGDYTHQMLNEFWWRRPVDVNSPKLTTLLAGLRDRLGKEVRISYARGCDWSSRLEKVGSATPGVGDPREKLAQRKPLEAIPETDPQAALKIAAQSDVIIAAMGENRYLCGEGKDRADVRLPGEQEQFVRQLVATGKPVILVVFGGRPMALTDAAAGCRAVVYAWYPGQEGGFAVADLLLGRFNPSGKLTITLPRSNQQVPVFYRAGYSASDPPLYPFGYGLSYTTFSYSKLETPATAKTSDTTIPVRFQLTNTGRKEGVEIGQLYFAPVKPSPGQRPIELKGFVRIDLKPGEAKSVTIAVSPQQLARHDDAGTLTIEPGSYTILVGASSTDIRLRATLDLTGENVVLPHREKFFSQTTVQ